MCSRYVSASPGPPLVGGGPSERKNLGSLTADMKSRGCRASVACSAVVPAFGAPITRKSGMGTWASREDVLDLTITIRLVGYSCTGYPYPAAGLQSCAGNAEHGGQSCPPPPAHPLRPSPCRRPR